MVYGSFDLQRSREVPIERTTLEITILSHIGWVAFPALFRVSLWSGHLEKCRRTQSLLLLCRLARKYFSRSSRVEGGRARERTLDRREK